MHRSSLNEAVGVKRRQALLHGGKQPDVRHQMIRKPWIEIHRKTIGAAELKLNRSANGCGFSIGRAQCNSSNRGQSPV